MLIGMARSSRRRPTYDDFDADVIKRPYKRKKFKKADWNFIITEEWDQVDVMSPDDLFNFDDVKRFYAVENHSKGFIRDFKL